MPEMFEPVDTMTYAEFLAYMRRHWHLGEHIGVIGHTGAGKTFIVRDLLDMRKHSVVIATKSKDKTLDLYEYRKIQRWPPDYDQTHVILWIKPKELGDFSAQQWEIYQAMNDIFKVGGWAVGYDDLYYVSNTLGLKRAVQMFYTQVRSNNVSIVANMQRPQWNVLEAVSQATYLILFKIRDKVDIERVAQGVGISNKELIAAVGELQEYEFLLLESGCNPKRIGKRPS